MYFLLLVLRISLYLGPDISYKRKGFFKALLEKNLEFVLSKRSSLVVLNLSLVLFSAKVYPIPKEQNCKKNALMACGIGRVKIILTLSIKIETLHVQTPII